MTSANHSIGTHGFPRQVKEKGSVCGIARWSRIHWPVAICQLTSPSLKMVVELPRTAGISRTAMNRARIDEPSAFACFASAIRLAGSSRTRPLRRAAAVDRVKNQPDHLRSEEEKLGPDGQTVEEIQAAADAAQSDHPRQWRSECALRIRLAAAKDEHCCADRDERRQGPGIRQSGNAGERDQAGKNRRDDRGEDGDPDRRAALRHAREAARQQAVAGDGEKNAALAVEKG